MGCLASTRLTAGVAAEVVAAIFRDVGVENPEVFLALHALDGCAFLVPDGRDVEEDIGLRARSSRCFPQVATSSGLPKCFADCFAILGF